MLTDEQIQEIESITEKATPEPWVDLTHEYYRRCEADKKKTGRWYHGSRNASMPLTFIAQGTHHGEPIDLDQIPRRLDRYELKTVFCVLWSDLPQRTRSVFNGFFRKEDMAFITRARSAIPALIETIRRLQDENERLRAGQSKGPDA